MAGAIVTFTVIECVNDPETPVMISTSVEVVVEGPTLTVKVEDTDPFTGGVMELGEIVADTPLGGAETLKVTGELNPLVEFTVTEAVPGVLALTVIGEIVPKKKSGAVGEILVTKALVAPPRDDW